MSDRKRTELTFVIEELDTPENRVKYLGNEDKPIDRRVFSEEFDQRVNEVFNMVEGVESIVEEVHGASLFPALLSIKERIKAGISTIAEHTILNYATDDLEKLRLREERDINPLTHLYNGGRFERDLERKVGACLSEAQRQTDKNDGDRITDPSEFSVFYIDLDHFKNINDTYGHLGGDEVLRVIGKRLKDKSNFAYRIGGEEFAVLVKGSLDQRLKAAQEILETIREDITLEGGYVINVTASIGVAHYSKNSVATSNIKAEANNLKATADESLYEAKQNGRDQVARPKLKLVHTA